MSILSSRPQEIQAVLEKHRILVTEDHTIDPPETRIIKEAEWPEFEETLLIKPAGAPITVYDLIVVLDKLGFFVYYEELK
jgi:hypothetical protein